jgi:hypothetical protein
MILQRHHRLIVLRGVLPALALSTALQGAAQAQHARPAPTPGSRQTGVAAPGEPVLHYVTRPGDTLIGLGQRLLRDPAAWPGVQRLNHIADPRRMQPGTTLRIPVALLRASPDTATAQVVDGTVQWRLAAGASTSPASAASAARPSRPPGNASDWQTLRSGQSLPSGAQVRVLGRGTALLLLANGTRVQLLPDSLLDLDSLRSYAQGTMHDSHLGLQHGQANILDNPKHEPNQSLRIITPGAQAVVRGTAFRVDYAAGVTRQTTLEGAVELSAGGARVAVNQGYGSLSANGQPPMPPVQLLPKPDLSGLVARVERLPLRLSWAAQPGARSWLAQVTPADAPLRILARSTVTEPALTLADLPDGHYLLRVSALDAQQLQGYGAERGFEVAARPFAPLLQSPGRQAVVRLARPAFDWSEVQGSARYALQVCPQADCATPLLSASVAAPPWTPGTDLPPGTLFWRMASIDAGGKQGPWNDADPFTYKPAPGPVDLGQSALRFTPDTLDVNLPPPPDGLQYRFTLAGSAAPAKLLQTVVSADGRAQLQRPSGGAYLLGVSLVDSRDGTAGPVAQQKVNVPPRYPDLWLLLVPLLAAL